MNQGNGNAAMEAASSGVRLAGIARCQQEEGRLRQYLLGPYAVGFPRAPPHHRERRWPASATSRALASRRWRSRAFQCMRKVLVRPDPSSDGDGFSLRVSPVPRACAVHRAHRSSPTASDA
jgi:hypothetical protein